MAIKANKTHSRRKLLINAHKNKQPEQNKLRNRNRIGEYLWVLLVAWVLIKNSLVGFFGGFKWPQFFFMHE